MSHTTAPPIVRLATRTGLRLAGARRSRGVKRQAGQIDTDTEAHTTRARVWRPGPWLKMPDTSAVLAGSASLSPSPVDLEIWPHDLQFLTPGPSPPSECPRDDLSSIAPGGGISADATRASHTPKPSDQALVHSRDPLESGAVPNSKRRVDWERDAGDNSNHVSLPKRPRTSEPNRGPASDEENVSNFLGPLLSDDSSLSREGDHLPTPTVIVEELGISKPSASKETFPSSSDGLRTSFPLQKWQRPMSSPLGPRTSPYSRQSKISCQPSTVSSNFAKDRLIRNVINE